MRLWLSRVLRLLWPLVLARITVIYVHDLPSVLMIAAFILLGLITGLIMLVWRRRPMTLLSFLMIPAFFLFQFACPGIVGGAIDRTIISKDRLFYAMGAESYAACARRGMQRPVTLCWSGINDVDGMVVIYDPGDEIMLDEPRRPDAWRRALAAETSFDACPYDAHLISGHFYRVFFDCS